MTVLVGYVPTPLGEATLRAGLEESRRRGEPLVVVHMSRHDVLVDAHRAAMTTDADFRGREPGEGNSLPPWLQLTGTACDPPFA